MHIETLRAIQGIEIFPVISLVLFVLVFSVMLVRTIWLDADGLARHARLPLDDAPRPGGATDDRHQEN